MHTDMCTHTPATKVVEMQRLYPIFCDFYEGKELCGFGQIIYFTVTRVLTYKMGKKCVN